MRLRFVADLSATKRSSKQMERKKGLKRKISLLAFDLDGTLLNSSLEISEFTLSQIRSIVEKKIKVTICSGRVPALQELYLKQLSLDGPYVACNGALIPHRGNADLFAKPLNTKEVEKLYHFFKAEKLHACFQTRDEIYFSDNNPRQWLVKRYNLLAGERGLPQAPMEELPALFDHKAVVYKAMVYAPEKEQFEKVRSFLERETEIAYTFSEKGLFDLISPGIDKGFGIKKIADYYGIPYEEVCAFGDHDNDIPFFQAVGTSVAMGNAVPHLKAIATFVTDSNDRDGVGKAIQRLAVYFGE